MAVSPNSLTLRRFRGLVLSSAVAVLSVALGACDPAPRQLELAKARNTSEAYREFLARHPESDAALRNEAQRLIQELQRQTLEREADRFRTLSLQKADAAATLPAYREVVRVHPDTAQGRAAEAAIDRLLAERKPPLDGASKLGLTFDLELEGEDGVGLEARLRDFFARTLAYAGIELVEGSLQLSDGVLHVTARGAPLGAEYSRTGLSYGSSYRATAAKLSGAFELRLKSGVVERRDFSARIKPPEAVGGGADFAVPYDQAAGLPVRNGHDLYSDLRPPDGTLAARWLQFLREFGGPAVARAALADSSGEQWRAALLFAARWRADGAADALLGGLRGIEDNDQLVQALGELGGVGAVDALVSRLGSTVSYTSAVAIAEALGRLRDPRAVGPLIARLEAIEAEKLDYETRDDAIVKALRAITSHNLGLRAGPWRQWHDARRGQR